MLSTQGVLSRAPGEKGRYKFTNTSAGGQDAHRGVCLVWKGQEGRCVVLQ